MSVADILRQAGLRPRVPDSPPRAGNAEGVALHRVPDVPAVPRSEQVDQETRSRLRALAVREGRDIALVERIPAADLPEYASLSDAQLVAVLSMLADSADMEAGRVPLGYTTPTLCAHCGPVWCFGQPEADGWARVLGCPWCHVKMPTGHRLPRPRVESCTCEHWTPDTVNPAGGRGQCACGPFWPHERNACESYRPGAHTKQEETWRPGAQSSTMNEARVTGD